MTESRTVVLQGADIFQAQLERAQKEMLTLAKPYKKASQTVAKKGRPKAPVLTGALKKSIKPAATTKVGKVKAGGPAVPYANPVHWGWRKRNIEPNPFLMEAAQESEPEWLPFFMEQVELALGICEGMK